MLSATKARSVHVIATGENRPHAAVFLRHHRALHSVRRSPGRRVRDGRRGAAHTGRSTAAAVPVTLHLHLMLASTVIHKIHNAS